MPRYYADPALRPKLDPALYSLQPDELEFFQHLTGIKNEDALKGHILSVQAKAYDLYGYPCIWSFAFIRLKIARLPAYPRVLKLPTERKDPILLDIGCCWFWDYGHDLFKSTPESFPAAFIPGDVFDPSTLSLSAPSSDPLPPLTSFKSLTPLLSRVSAIHASAFFHLFSEDEQLSLAKRLGALLLPVPGSIIFGQHGAKPVKGFRTDRLTTKNGGSSMFCHSSESWREMWTQGVFGPDQPVRVQVDAELVESKWRSLAGQTDATEQDKFWNMNWSVIVL